MESTPLWHVLVMDWSAIENTPPSDRRPLEMQRWHFRVERLADAVDRSVALPPPAVGEPGKNTTRRRARFRISRRSR